MLPHPKCILLTLSVSLAIVPVAHAQHSSDADDAGRFFAGLPGAPSSSYAPFENTPAWKEHRRQLDDAWQKAETGLLPGLREFQKQELGGAAVANPLVFYPFGGPDVLTATLCFPNTPVYVIVSLEPAGTLPTAEQVAKRNLSAYLSKFRESQASELGRSFFITRQMDRQFRGQVTDGLLLPILHLLVRTHRTILGFRYVRLDDDGRIIDREAGYKAPGRFGNKGVEIEFRSDSAKTVQKLYYFSVNLSDERLRENKPFLAYAAGLKGATTLLKATSYMTHRAEFSMIRELMLTNSSAILQDDSGIPFHWFLPEQWLVRLYGVYSRPYGSFHWLVQTDLRKAYETTSPTPLTFAIGYGYSKAPSNLLLARRIPADETRSKPESQHSTLH